MYKINKPTFDIEDHLNNCIKNCHMQRQELHSFIPQILERVVTYDSYAIDGKLYKLLPIKDFPFDGNRLKTLYQNYMLKGNGRHIYDELILSADNRLCPFCSGGTVTTLDHFLPQKVKNGYPELSIVPINLVPCCSTCQGKKSDRYSSIPEDQYLHPYYDYDNLYKERWLFAKVNYDINDKLALDFYVDCPDDMESLLKARINYHFEKLELNEIYSRCAASALSDLKNIFITLSKLGLNLSIKEYLYELAKTMEASKGEFWKISMYYELSEDDRYCSGDY